MAKREKPKDGDQWFNHLANVWYVWVEARKRWVPDDEQL